MTEWAWKLFTWDGVLPLLVVLTPVGLRAVFPNIVVRRDQMNVIELASLVLPVVAFCVRYAVGRRQLERLGGAWRMAPFVLGLLLLSLGECAYILLADNPGVPDENPATILLTLYAIYLPLVAVAFFPLENEP